MQRRLAVAAALFAAAVLGLTAALAPAADEPKKDDAGWVQLFNGKNLNGWVAQPEDKARWSVQDGSIVGEGPVGHLYTERGDYENFDFRIEAMISDGGNSGQYFRSEIAKGFPPAHYEAQIDATHGDPHAPAACTASSRSTSRSTSPTSGSRRKSSPTAITSSLSSTARRSWTRTTRNIAGDTSPSSSTTRGASFTSARRRSRSCRRASPRTSDRS